jgi:hypothetical protein
MKRCGLDGPRLKAELYGSGWLYLSAEEALGRGLVHEVF